MALFCNNCGERGHVFRLCESPIISCGLLLLRGEQEPLTLPADPRYVRALMVRRKDSLAYMEFLRGKYDVDTLYLYTIFRNMTRDEQRRVVETPFPALWTALWGNGRDTHSQEYTDAKEKFESLDRAQLVANNPSVFEEPEWGIPKGRRMRKETDADCAVREFFEETNIPRDAYTLCQNLQFSETFQGTNGLMYRHNYFIALLVDTAWVDVNPILTYVQKREISQVAWKSLDECRSIIRPYYEDRRTLYTDVERAIQTFETLG